MGYAALAGTAAAGGRPTRRDSDKRLTRLLKIAQRRFLTLGYSETTLEGIAQEASVAKKTLYHHFGSKEGLFTKILDTLCSEWVAELNDIVLSSRRPEQVLNSVAQHLLDVGTRPDMIGLHRLFLVEAHRFPALVRNLYDKRGAMRGMEPLSDYLRSAIAAGALRLDDVPLATEQFVQLVLGGIRVRLLLGITRRPHAEDRRRIARQAVTIFLSGCVA
jgi:AcrR family transcriptional regulator